MLRARLIPAILFACALIYVYSHRSSNNSVSFGFGRLLYGERISFFEKWRADFLGANHPCIHFDLSSRYETAAKKMIREFQNEIGPNLSGPEIQQLVRGLLAIQNELSLLKWRKEELVKVLPAPDGPLSERQNFLLQLLQKELDYVHKNSPRRLRNNHEYSDKILSFHYRNLSKDNFLKEALQSALNILGSLPAEAQLSNQQYSQIVNATMNFGWNLSGIFAYEMVRVQYCGERESQ